MCVVVSCFKELYFPFKKKGNFLPHKRKQHRDNVPVVPFCCSRLGKVVPEEASGVTSARVNHPHPSSRSLRQIFGWFWGWEVQSISLLLRFGIYCIEWLCWVVRGADVGCVGSINENTHDSWCLI